MVQVLKNFIFFGLLITLYSLLITGGVHAQTSPQVIFTWQAYNYYPSDYAGKGLPTSSSQVLISAEVLERNVPVNLSNAIITWFVDGKFLSQGIGLKEIPFSVTRISGDAHTIRALIRLGEQTIEGVERINVGAPELVIEKNFPGEVVTGGQNINFDAIPYFFNISSLNDLIFSWRVNDQEAGEFQDNRISIDLGTIQSATNNLLNLEIFTQNKSNPTEIKSSSLTLSVVNP